LRLTGRAAATVEVVTLARPVERGEVLKSADILIERRPRGEIGRDIVTKADQVVGFAARSLLQPERPLRTADLMRPELVQRNETVTLVYEVPGITLTVRGKATEGGAEGDMIAVLNEQSKRTVQGVVTGPGRVVINTGLPRLAANLPVTPRSTGSANVR
jgi:flagella basal body P-ring formation protein FlgA